MSDQPDLVSNKHVSSPVHRHTLLSANYVPRSGQDPAQQGPWKEKLPSLAQVANTPARKTITLITPENSIPQFLHAKKTQKMKSAWAG